MENHFDIADKVICISGASKGIGRYLTEALSKKGAHIIGIARDIDSLTQLKDTINARNHSFHYIQGDLADEKNIVKIVDQVKAIAHPDIIINAAGVNLRGNADTLTAENWQQTLNINLSAPFFLTRLFIEEMKNKKWGRVINIASLQSYRAFDNGIAYGATKGGIVQLTRAMAQQWSIHGINCNAIAPGFFPTELTKVLFDNDQMIDKLTQQTCIGRTGEFEDLLGPTIFLASDASRYVTGHTLSVDGGFLAK